MLNAEGSKSKKAFIFFLSDSIYFIHNCHTAVQFHKKTTLKKYKGIFQILAHAQFTHLFDCGINIILPKGIGFLHRTQMPKSLSSTFVKASSSFFNLFSDCFNEASFILLLLMASMRLTRPIAFSGEIGRVSSFKSDMLCLTFLISDLINCFTSLRSNSITT